MRLRQEMKDKDVTGMRYRGRRKAGRSHALIWLCVFLLSAMILPAAGAAGEETGTVRVGYYENEVFQEGASIDAIKTGYAYEYYLKLSEYTGWKYEYIYGSYSELYQMLLDGRVDLLAGLAWKEERSGLIGYPDAAMGHETYSLVKHDTDTDITAEPSTIAGKKIGVLDSAMVGVLENWLESKGVSADVVRFTDYAELFTAFDKNKVDILAAEGDGAYGREHAEVLCSFGASDYYLCVNIQRPDLLTELNLAQAQLAVEEPNYLHSLNSKYYSVSMSSRAFSASEREWIDGHSELKVGYLNNYLPYSDTDAQGKVTGIVQDMVPGILNGLGIDGIVVSYQPFDNYDDMIAAVNDGSVDAVFPVGGGLYYSEENGIYQSSAVVSAPTELVYSGEYSDRKTESFAVNEQNRMQYYYITTNYREARILTFPSIDDCLKAVLDGKAGGTTLNGLRANDILKNRKYRELSMRQLTRNDDRCFGVKIGNEGLLKLLNRGISVLGPEYAQSISYRYTDGLYSVSLMDMLRDNMAVVGSVILAVAALIIFLLVRGIRQSRKETQTKEQARLELEEKNKELAEGREALSKALDAAENASRAKTTFLNNMSHDIRTPMNAIVGFTELASTHIDNKEQVQDYLSRISVSSQHLLSLINDVLDMSRIESGDVTIEEADVHLPDVIRDIHTIIEPSTAAKHQKLTVSTQGILNEDIVTDKLRLNQILLNILSNAVKFTPDGGEISLKVSQLPMEETDIAEYVFRIKDNGIGMSEEFRQSIFEAFARERTSTVSGIQGTGLGMAITKNIVDMMGGTITVESEVNKGTEVTVILPCRFSSGAQEAEMPADDTGFSGKKVLLAEDNEMNQMIAEEILKQHGFAVESAGDGEEAVRKMTEAPAGSYDVILMDIQMPRMDGYEAARQIRRLEDQEKAGIPIIAVTANAFEEDRKGAMEAGMDGHLAKPYDIPKMMETLHNVLRKKDKQ